MKNHPKACYSIGHVIYDSPGGAGNVVFRLLENIKSDRLYQEAILFGTLLQASPFYTKYSDRVTINLLSKHRGFDFKFLLSLLKLIKRKKYDLIFLHDSTASMYGRMAKLFSPKTKVVSVCHGTRPNKHLAGIADLLTGTALTDSIVCVSEFVKRQLPKPLGRKAQVIYNGIEWEVLSEDWPENSLPIVASVCRLEPPKDPMTLLKACKRLFEEGLDFKCKIAGEGKQFGDLEKYIMENNLEDKIELLGWQENVYPLLAKSDIFALSSYSEGLPLSLLEAMSMSLPIVSSNVGGTPELVQHNDNGYLFEAGNDEDLSMCLSQLISNPELRRAMGLRSLELAKNFSFSKFINSWTNFIIKTLS